MLYALNDMPKLLRVSVFCFIFAASFNHKTVLIMTETTPQIKSIVGGIFSVVYQSNGNSYRFNLTKMAKPFGKRVRDWVRLKETQEYLTALQHIVSDAQMCASLDSLIVTQKGNPANLEQGTWTSDWHVALNFARWLSP